MRLSAIFIENYKCIYGRFHLDFTEGMNLLVGDNEAGKTTILEAVHLVLTGQLHGKHLGDELSQSLFNDVVVKEFIRSIKNDQPMSPPAITIQAFFDGDRASPEYAKCSGSNNFKNVNASGVTISIEFDNAYAEEYREFIKTKDVNSIPLEYYHIQWHSFADQSIL